MQWQFIFVDCEKGVCRPAFDHQTLASTLSQDGEALDAKKLPLGGLNLYHEGSWVRLKYKENTWQFSQDGSLQEWQGEYDSGDVDVDCDFKKLTPKNAMGKTDLLITNQTTAVVHYCLDQA